MTTFRGIEVVAVPDNPDIRRACEGCMAMQQPECDSIGNEILCYTNRVIAQPAALHDGRPRVVLTGGRKPSFPIKAVWFRDGTRHAYTGGDHWNFRASLAVERADEGSAP
jgi:hypothetical protein